MSSFDRLKATYLESWPEPLMELSMETRLIRLQPRQRDALIDEFSRARYGEPVAEVGMSRDEVREEVRALQVQVDHELATFPGGAFVKLGSRSPKDSWLGHKDGFKVASASRVLDLFTDSERVLDDLFIARHNEYAPSIAICRWVDIDPTFEFRCFVNKGALLGASQYDHFKVYPRLVERAQDLAGAIRSFVLGEVVPRLHLDTVIVDVAWIRRNGALAPLLIKINPYDELTDPCLFKYWEGLDGEPALRVLGADKELISVPLDLTARRGQPSQEMQA